MKNKQYVKWIQRRENRLLAKLSRFLYVFFVIGFNVLLSNCNCEPLELPDVKAFQIVKGETFNDMSSQMKNPQSPETINIFIDTSYSNKGFIAPDNSAFLTRIRDLCAILNPNVNVKFYIFGSSINLVGSRVPGKIDGERLSDVLSKIGDVGIYTDSQTRFDILFDFLEKSENKSDLNLILTDGIHSENKNTANVYVELANYIRKFVSKNKLFGLLASRGQFKGTYYTESSCPNIPQFEGIRSFYCFLFGSIEHIEFIKTHLLGQWQKNFLLYPALLDKITVNKSKMNIGFDDNLIKEGGIILRNMKSTDTFSIPVTLTSKDFRHWNLEKFVTTLDMKKVEIYQGCGEKMDGVKQKKYLARLEHSVDVLSFNGKNELALNVNFKPENEKGEKGICIYRLVITPNIPNWINEWSTDTDCTVEDAQKTYGLKNFMKNLLAVTSDSRFDFVSLYFIESRR